MSSGFGTALSEHPQPAVATGEAIGAVLEQIGHRPDICFVFLSGHPSRVLGDVTAAVQHALDPSRLIGAVVSTAIGATTEVENGPGLSIWAARVGPAELVRLDRVPDGRRGHRVRGLPDPLTTAGRTLVLLADPNRFPPAALRDLVAQRLPGLTLIGGTVAPSPRPGEPTLAVGAGTVGDGAVGILLPPGLGEFVRVSQGCRPVGRPLVVTEAEGNRLRGLGSQPVLDRLRQVYEAASAHDRELLGTGLHLGIAVDEGRDPVGSGDFLVRGVLEIDRRDGALRVGDHVEVGRTVQFHVRDPSGARRDLVTTLDGVDADAALVFSDTGRGQRFFGVPDHDVTAVARAVGPMVAGAHGDAQLGPVGGRNQVHGHSVSALFLYG